MQQRLVVDLRVLHFGEELRVIDRDCELTAQHLQRVLLNRSVNPPGNAGAEKHDAGEMFARENAHHDCDLEVLHLTRNPVDLRRRTNAAQFIEHERFGIFLEVLDERFVMAKLQRSVACARLAKGITLHVTGTARQQDDDPIRRDCFADRLGKAFEQIIERADGLQDGSRFAHRSAEVEAARPGQ